MYTVPRGLGKESSVVIRATHVIAALGANQLAMMPAQPMPAGRTDLAVMIDGRLAIPRRFILWDGSSRIVQNLLHKIRIEGTRTLGKHG